VAQAIIFDFDGLILDTETPLFDAWQRIYDHFGLPPITVTEWAHSLGRGDDDPELLDPAARIVELTNGAVTAADVQAQRRRVRDDLLDDQPIQPGVLELVAEAEERGVALAVASSSPWDWVGGHLEARGLHGRFPVVECAGAGRPGKPDPAVYLAACRALGVDPAASVALEDSPHGATAAKRAGLSCVAVPTELGRELDFGHADAVVHTLAGVDVAAIRSLIGRPAS